MEFTNTQLEVLMRALTTAHESPRTLPADKKDMQEIGDVLFQAWVKAQRPAANECVLCGEAFADHRTASDNTEPFCMSRASRFGDRFVR